MRLPDGAQLGYCTNVHAGESASEVVDSLRRVAVRVREHLGVGSLGLGLYLSHRAAPEVEPRKLRAELAALGLYAFTFTGSPYRAFPAERVKEAVCRPGCTPPRRAEPPASLVATPDPLAP